MVWKWIASIALPLGVGAACAKWVELTTWQGMAEGLVAFLGLLSAALIQVMPVTANFIQSDRLTPEEARRLSRQLLAQQRYWLGLLGFAVADFVVVVLAKVLPSSWAFVAPAFLGGASINFPSGPCASFCVGALTTLVIVKMGGIFQGVLSLQILRNDLVVSAAERAAAEKIQEATTGVSEATPPAVTLPSEYGRILRH